MQSKKQRAEEIMNAIREVLVNDWDPIGVMEYPGWPRDEYDAYIGRIYSRLASGESAESIAKYLCFVECEQMGLGEPRVSERLGVAEKLKAIDVALNPDG